MGKINKLKEWRNRYSKSEYPYKVIMNMFYELITMELIWDEINSAFSGQKKASNQEEALIHLGEIKRNAQVQYVHPQLEKFLKSDKMAGGAKFSDFKDSIEKAKNGNNHMVIEIEYSYWFYCQYYEAVLEWAAYGYLGLDKNSAYREVTGGDVGGLKLDSFQDAIQFFPSVLGISFSYKDENGNSIDPMSAGDKKYYPEDFEILPALFPESTNIKRGSEADNKKDGCFIATATYESHNAPEVLFLRKWRDDILLKSISGRIFVDFYYKISPIIAIVINKFWFLKGISKTILNILIKLLKSKI